MTEEPSEADEPPKRGILGTRVAGIIALVVSGCAMAAIQALKDQPELLPGPILLFLAIAASSAGAFALISIKLKWLYDPEVHRRHFGLMAMALPLHYVFFAAILGAHVQGFMPAVSWLATLLFVLATSYSSASLAALVVIHRARFRLR